MATYVNDLRLKEIATGDESGTWGTSTNTNLELIAEAFSFGTEGITTNADTHTTTIADGSTDPGRSIFLKYTGTLDSACTITIGPNTVSKLWFIENATSGSQNIIISQGSGASITIPNGHVKAIYSDGAGSGAAMVDAFTDLNLAGTTTIDVLSASGNATIGGTLGVTGIVTLTDDLIIGDGKTIGSASDVDAMTIASNGQVTFTQTLIGTALDISGDIDVDGTTNLDVVDIDGAVDMASTLQVDGAITFSSTLNGIDILADATNFTNSILISQNASTGTLSSASNNTGVGDTAFASLTSGNDNAGFGFKALTLNTTGSDAVAVGAYSLQRNTTGSNNVAVGYDALGNNTTASDNTAIGKEALQANTTGSRNTALGFEAGKANTLGFDSTFIGYRAGLSNTTASGNDSRNTAVGSSSLASNTTAANNTAVGYASLNANTTGTYNVAVGSEALTASTTASNNAALGFFALKNNTTGAGNTALGSDALQQNTTASNNTAVGKHALLENTTGADNTAVGALCMDANTTGVDNVALGSEALTNNTTASHNTAVGYRTLQQNTTGQYNSGFGKYALQNNTTASNNTAVGYASLGANTTGSNNNAVGVQALDACTTGSHNVAMGLNSLGALTTANENTAIGHSSGASVTTGSNNVLLGHDAGVDALGQIVAANNYIMIGNNSTTNFETKVALTVGSDERDKTDIENLPDNAGLNFVNQMRPVTYVWDNRTNYYPHTHEKYGERDHSKKSSDKQLGFLAQEIKAIENSIGWTDDHVVNTSNANSLKLMETQLIPILVKALQEADAKIEALTTRITTLEG